MAGIVCLCEVPVVWMLVKIIAYPALFIGKASKYSVYDEGFQCGQSSEPLGELNYPSLFI